MTDDADGTPTVGATVHHQGHPGMTALPTDVVIGDWARPWNVYGDRSVLGAPPAPLWATDPDGFGQVGCVYTAQGFEYDWSGVIIGPDLCGVRTAGSWTVPRRRTRSSRRRHRTVTSTGSSATPTRCR